MDDNEYDDTSLTSPGDMQIHKKYIPKLGLSPLTNIETNYAMEKNNDTKLLSLFPKVERRYADPTLKFQNIGLISFIPSKGATPDKDGFFGFAKLRGNFETEVEANERAEFLIRNVDSYHKIYHSYVGRPFPITTLSTYTKDIKEIDIHKKVSEEISSDIKKKREEDKKEIQNIKEREKNLQKEVDKESIDTSDLYTTLRTKKAQLIWTYLETLKKIDQMKNSIIKTRTEINNMDNSDPTLNTIYFDKFMEARKEAGFKDNIDKLENSFIKYMIEEVDLGF